MIAGLETVSSGNIFIHNKNVTWEAPKNRNVAMVFQNYALYPHMSVYGKSLGAAIATEFAALDYKVVISGRNFAACQKKAAEIGSGVVRKTMRYNQ